MVTRCFFGRNVGGMRGELNSNKSEKSKQENIQKRGARPAEEQNEIVRESATRERLSRARRERRRHRGIVQARATECFCVYSLFSGSSTSRSALRSSPPHRAALFPFAPFTLLSLPFLSSSLGQDQHGPAGKETRVRRLRLSRVRHAAYIVARCQNELFERTPARCY